MSGCLSASSLVLMTKVRWVCRPHKFCYRLYYIECTHLQINQIPPQAFTQALYFGDIVHVFIRSLLLIANKQMLGACSRLMSSIGWMWLLHRLRKVRDSRLILAISLEPTDDYFALHKLLTQSSSFGVLQQWIFYRCLACLYSATFWPLDEEDDYWLTIKRPWELLLGLSEFGVELESVLHDIILYWYQL